MPLLLKRKLVEGQHIRYSLGFKDINGNLLSLTGATQLRIYYRILNRETKVQLFDDYWDEADGVTIVSNRLRFIQSNAPEGFYSAFPHAQLPTGEFINRSGDPAQFFVKKIHEL